jgi:hypothetical protein
MAPAVGERVNVDTGYAISRRLELFVDVFNLFNRRVNDIDYFYVSRLAGEPAAGVDDIHSHPAPARTLRAGVKILF